MADDWRPKSAVPADPDDDDWRPASARRVVKGYSRRPPQRKNEMLASHKPTGEFSWTRHLVDEAPNALAFGGAGAGFVNPAAGAVLAPAGAVAGSVIRDALGPAVGLAGTARNFGEMEQNARNAATLQAGANVAGGALAGGAGKVGKLTMRAAANLTPRAAQAALDNGIRATSGGLRKAQQMIQRLASDADHYARQATRMGVRIDNRLVTVAAMGDVAEMAASSRNSEAALRQLRKMAQEYLDSHGPSTTPYQAHRNRINLDAQTRGFHRAQKKGQYLGAAEGLDDAFSRAIANRQRDQLKELVPDYEDLMERNGALQELREQMWPTANELEEMKWVGRAARAAAPRAGGAVLGGSAAAGILPGDDRRNFALGAGAGALISNPWAMSNAAAFMNSNVLAQLLQQAPRGFGALAQP